MTRLHPCPEDHRIPDWEQHQDTRVVLFRGCGKVLEIVFFSQPGEILEMLSEILLETIY